MRLRIHVHMSIHAKVNKDKEENIEQQQETNNQHTQWKLEKTQLARTTAILYL